MEISTGRSGWGGVCGVVVGGAADGIGVQYFAYSRKAVTDVERYCVARQRKLFRDRVKNPARKHRVGAIVESLGNAPGACRGGIVVNRLSLLWILDAQSDLARVGETPDGEYSNNATSYVELEDGAAHSRDHTRLQGSSNRQLSLSGRINSNGWSRFSVFYT